MPARHDTTQPLTATAASSVEEPTQEKNKPFDADQFALFVARLDALVYTTCSKIPTTDTAEGQLRVLYEIRHLLATRESTKTQFVWTVFLQTFGLIFALLFGIFAALSYNIGAVANVQTSDANQLAFLSLCLSSNSSLTNTICEEIFAKSYQSLPSLATSIFSSLGSSLAGNSTTSATASSFSLSDRIALGVGIGIGLPSILMALITAWSTFSACQSRVITWRHYKQSIH